MSHVQAERTFPTIQKALADEFKPDEVDNAAQTLLSRRQRLGTTSDGFAPVRAFCRALTHAPIGVAEVLPPRPSAPPLLPTPPPAARFLEAYPEKKMGYQSVTVELFGKRAKRLCGNCADYAAAHKSALTEQQAAYIARTGAQEKRR